MGIKKRLKKAAIEAARNAAGDVSGAAIEGALDRLGVPGDQVGPENIGGQLDDYLRQRLEEECLDDYLRQRPEEECAEKDPEDRLPKKSNWAVKDSGSRREFATGAVRDDAGDKDRPDLVSPYALMRVGKWLAMGAAKYGDRNWEKGMPYSVFYASALRHLLKFHQGYGDEDHLAAVCFNIMAIMHFEEVGRDDLDDMPVF
jgi:hypothetical protein